MGVEFNENYVEQMYGADMVIRLLDGNDQPILDADGDEVSFPNQWAERPAVELSEAEIAYTTSVEACEILPATGYQLDQQILFANGVLLDEDFSGDLDQWTDVSAEPAGDWQIAGSQLVYTPIGTATLGALLVAGEESWSDYAIEVELSDQGDEVGLVFRHTQPEATGASYYRLRLTAVGRSLEQVIDDQVTIIWRDGTAYVSGESQTLAVHCLGARLRAQLDDELLFDLRDTADLLTGMVGIYTSASAAFTHFLVRSWPGGPLAPQTMYRAELLASFVLLHGGLASGWTDSTVPMPGRSSARTRAGSRASAASAGTTTGSK